MDVISESEVKDYSLSLSVSLPGQYILQVWFVFEEAWSYQQSQLLTCLSLNQIKKLRIIWTGDGSGILFLGDSQQGLLSEMWAFLINFIFVSK